MVLGAGIVLSVAARILRMQMEVRLIASSVGIQKAMLAFARQKQKLADDESNPVLRRFRCDDCCP